MSKSLIGVSDKT